MFYTRPVKSVYKGTKLLSYLTPKIWKVIPESVKSVNLLLVLEIAIKRWKSNDCPCSLCQICTYPKYMYISVHNCPYPNLFVLDIFVSITFLTANIVF